MSDSPPPFPLLELPAGVEDLVVSFISWGDGGLRNVLNLRSVCRTTQSWVDNLPEPQADVAFSRAQVTMNSNVQSIRRFVESPPPLRVTALSLQIDSVSGDVEASLEERDAWTAFCALWNSRLETLELRSDETTMRNLSERVLQLVELPNIHSLQLSFDMLFTDISNLPMCFQKIREFRAKTVTHEHLAGCRFYTQLEENENLRLLDVALFSGYMFFGYANFIDFKKDDTGLQVTFDMNHSLVTSSALDSGLAVHQLHHSNVEVLKKLLSSIVASNSTIRLKIYALREFEKVIAELFPPGSRLKLLSTIESVGLWTPIEGDSFSLLESLPRLKELDCLETEVSFVDFHRITFPSSLEHLGFTKGFPAVGNLSESLTSLYLSNYESDVRSLLTSLTLLSVRCPQLASLEIKWKSAVGNSRDLNFEAPARFSKLKKLIFTGNVKEAYVEECRAALSSGVDWGSMQLLYVNLNVSHKQAQVANEGILRQLCEGSSANTLLTVDVWHDCVTPEGIPWLEQLKSLAALNWRRREEKVGRGGWTKLYRARGWR